MAERQLGLWIAAAGVALVAGGLLLWSGALSWFGRLPGDIRIERETVRIYVPLASMILVSVVLTLLINLIRRLL
jgi:hypothetical protein